MKISDISKKLSESYGTKPMGIYIRLHGPKGEISDFAHYPISKIDELIEDLKGVNAKSVPGQGIGALIRK